MERAISLLAFKGSITEAVVEAKRQKKLFVVYISGHNPESIQLEESTWTDQRVAESISKYCILLHILDGSTEATQFSAIYPQKSVPCIAAVGYNGVQVWQSEGFVSAEILASSLEKAWLSLHIQETTATFLTAAALASSKAEQAPASDASSSEQGSSSKSDEQQSPSKHNNKLVHSSETTNPEIHDDDDDTKCSEHAVEGINPKPADAASPSSVIVSDLESGVSIPSTITVKEPLNPVKTEELNNTQVNNNVEASGVIVRNEAKKPVVDKKVETLEEDADKTEDILETCRNKSNDDVHLNIRLPNGTSLQQKFSVTSTLRSVKDYVDENQESGVGSYDLAIPYPRKIFDSQDLSKTLSELELFNRQALIVVPHHRASSYSGHDKAAASSSHNQAISNNNDVDSSNEGYFAYVKRIMSYVNPFTYLGGGGGASSASGPAQESRSSMWQYSPNPTVQNNLTRDSNVNSGGGTRRRREAEAGHFGSGSNIHTLKRDEDEDDRFTGKNAFWNGNSTQYGGDNNDTK